MVLPSFGRILPSKRAIQARRIERGTLFSAIPLNDCLKKKAFCTNVGEKSRLPVIRYEKKAGRGMDDRLPATTTDAAKKEASESMTFEPRREI